MKGKLIVIEGLDGSGKATQVKLLREALEKEGKRVVAFDFPQYGKPSAYFVEEYLKGTFGKAEEVGPEQASLFYALDRFSAKKHIRDALNQGSIVIANRYEMSNRSYQGQKFSDSKKRNEYFEWNKKIEYGMLGIPKPDIVIFLHVSPEIGQKLVGHKGERKYTEGKTHDIHEADLQLLKRTEKVYLEMAKDPEWQTISCVKNGQIMPIEEIHKKVIMIVKDFLLKSILE